MVKIRSMYDAPVVAAKFKSLQPSMTKQSMTDEVDLNKLVKKYPNMLAEGRAALAKGQYAGMFDLSHAPADLMDAMEAVQIASEGFMQLPAVIRDRFAHDPMQLLQFLSDPKNDDEAVEFGLKVRKRQVIDDKLEKLPADAGDTSSGTPLAESTE